MQTTRWILTAPLLLLPLISTIAQADDIARPAEMDWPALTKESRPWTYWWWMGSAVSKAELTRHLEMYRKAGMGGVHIVPIYGAEGYETQYIDYLSPRWMEMLAHTVADAKRLGMGVDMTTGTGWPFGGPSVSAEDANAFVVFETYALQPGERLGDRLQADSLQALVAYGDRGRIVHLTEEVATDGSLDWTVPDGTWTLYAVSQSAKGVRMVKRAAPGGVGYAVNPFSRRALENYLARFDKAFAGYQGDPVRAFYHDSYEYTCNWADDLLEQFEKRRAYKLQDHLPALLGKGPTEMVSRVRSDYRQTVAQVMLENFIAPWVKWSHGKGALTRNQAHGSPGNILDLYAAADIPATESYGTGWLTKSGLEIPPGIPSTFGGMPDLLVGKFASSAAHLTGRRLVGCESCTWLSEHFQVSLAQVKAELDLLFTLGVNHVFFHGMAYSPQDAGWPGWLFYAATNFGPSNTFWRELPELNAYIARCQSFLQAGRPDNEVLFYLPIYDLWSKERGAVRMLHHVQVHNSQVWLHENLAAFAGEARMMWDRGYGLDFVSDRMLQKAISVSNRKLQAGGTSYRVLVIAGCELMPAATLERIVALSREGATVLVVGQLPKDVPGWGLLQQRRRQFKETMAGIGPMKTVQPGIREAHLAQGRVLVGDDLEAMLRLAGVRREAVVDHGIKFIRRADPGGWTYFLANPGKSRLDAWVPLAVHARSVVVFDPLSRRQGLAALRGEKGGEVEVRLQLAPGESLILRALREQIGGPQWTYLSPAGDPQVISGTWQVDFIAGGPKLPGPMKMEKLASWSSDVSPKLDQDTWSPDADRSSEALRAFSGTARYTIDFQKPTVPFGRYPSIVWVLDLGRVCESARVKLNGESLGTLYARPFRICLGKTLRAGENRLEVEVTNLMANRIIDMERRGEPWCKCFFAYMTGHPPRTWQPLPSGLLGPVRLLPMTVSGQHCPDRQAHARSWPASPGR